MKMSGSGIDEKAIRSISKKLLSALGTEKEEELLGQLLGIVYSPVDIMIEHALLMNGCKMDEHLLVEFFEKMSTRSFLENLLQAESISTYIRASVRNFIVDHLRKNPPVQHIEFFDENTPGSSCPVAEDSILAREKATEDQRRLHEVFQKISIEERILLKLARHFQLEVEELDFLAKKRKISREVVEKEIENRTERFDNKLESLNIDLEWYVSRKYDLDHKIQRIRSIIINRGEEPEPGVDPLSRDDIDRLRNSTQRLRSASLKELSAYLEYLLEKQRRVVSKIQDTKKRILAERRSPPQWEEIAKIYGAKGCDDSRQQKTVINTLLVKEKRIRKKLNNIFEKMEDGDQKC